MELAVCHTFCNLKEFSLGVASSNKRRYYAAGELTWIRFEAPLKETSPLPELKCLPRFFTMRFIKRETRFRVMVVVLMQFI